MMKAWQSLAAAAIAVVGVNAHAAGFKEFIGSSHDSFTRYNYAEANLLLYPDDYKGVGLRGSYVVRPNIAVTGRYERLSAEVFSVDTTRTQVYVGGRYFFALPQLRDTDLDLRAYVTRAEAEGGSLSRSDTSFAVGSQLRHSLGNQWIGNTVFTTEEVYGGVRMGFSDGDASVAAHVGVVLGVNDLFSVKAELTHKDGTHLAIGARMELGKQQIDPGVPVKSSLSLAPAPQPAAPQVGEPSNPYGLTAEELADLEALAS